MGFRHVYPISVHLQIDPITRRAPSCNWSTSGSFAWQPDSRDADDPLFGVRGTFLGSIVVLSDDPTMQDESILNQVKV